MLNCRSPYPSGRRPVSVLCRTRLARARAAEICSGLDCPGRSSRAALPGPSTPELNYRLRPDLLGRDGWPTGTGTRREASRTTFCSPITNHTAFGRREHEKIPCTTTNPPGATDWLSSTKPARKNLCTRPGYRPAAALSSIRPAIDTRLGVSKREAAFCRGAGQRTRVLRPTPGTSIPSARGC